MIRRLLAPVGIGLGAAGAAGVAGAAGAAGVADRALVHGIIGGPPSTRAIRSLAVVEVPIERDWAAISDIAGQPRSMHVESRAWERGPA